MFYNKYMSYNIENPRIPYLTPIREKLSHIAGKLKKYPPPGKVKNIVGSDEIQPGLGLAAQFLTGEIEVYHVPEDLSSDNNNPAVTDVFTEQAVAFFEGDVTKTQAIVAEKDIFIA